MAEAAALALKEQGNRAFQAGHFEDAETFYGKAIQKHSTNPQLFTNRAFSRVKLEAWQGALDDCLRAIDLDPANLKAFYYLAQAQIGLNHPNEAIASALTAYEMALDTHSASTSHIVQLILRAKRQRWEALERERLREQSPLLAELRDDLLRRETEELDKLQVQCRSGELDQSSVSEQSEEVRATTRRKVEELQRAFAMLDPSRSSPREIPEWMIDDITFNFLHDPYVTKSGRSYERSAIEAHLKKSPTDPLTREPLTVNDLRPNLALKQACAEFLDKNGWAADW